MIATPESFASGEYAFIFPLPPEESIDRGTAVVRAMFQDAEVGAMVVMPITGSVYKRTGETTVELCGFTVEAAQDLTSAVDAGDETAEFKFALKHVKLFERIKWYGQHAGFTVTDRTELTDAVRGDIADGAEVDEDIA